MPRPVEITAKVAATAEDVAQLSAQMFADSVIAAVEARGIARVAISGGSTPKAVFELLANPTAPFLTTIPWTKLQLFWVDERCVPPDNHESNFLMTKDGYAGRGAAAA